MLYCWRCRMEVPMLEGEEKVKAYEIMNGKGNLFERLKAVVDYYNEVTGENYTNPNAVMHHFVDDYGPQCEKCGKPYRTKKATFCAGCGNKRNPEDIK